MRYLLCPDPWQVLGLSPPAAPAQPPYAVPIPSPDLHKVDWADVALPGAACGTARPVQLRRGRAFVHSTIWPWWSIIEVAAEVESYGDLAGDGRDAAAVGVLCSNGGGTADGQLAFADVIFAAAGNSLRVIGVITPRQPLDANASHAPILGRVEIRRGEIIAPEAWYGPNDGTCCASGRARTTWGYADGSLRLARTVIEREPSRTARR